MPLTSLWSTEPIWNRWPFRLPACDWLSVYLNRRTTSTTSKLGHAPIYYLAHLESSSKLSSRRFAALLIVACETHSCSPGESIRGSVWSASQARLRQEREKLKIFRVYLLRQARRPRNSFGDFLPPLRSSPKCHLRNQLVLSGCVDSRHRLVCFASLAASRNKMSRNIGSFLAPKDFSGCAEDRGLGCVLAYDQKTHARYTFDLRVF